MSIEIYAVHFEDTTKTHEAIEKYKWRGSNEPAGITDKPTMVKWIDDGNTVVVGSGVNETRVYTVHPTDGRRPYCQTISDGKWSNNLLSLPTF